MKINAFTLLAALSLSLASPACVQAEDTKTAEKDTPADPTPGGSFNLDLPTDTGDGPTSTSGFNLDLPTTAPQSTDGFNFGPELTASSGLSEVPEINTEIGVVGEPSANEPAVQPVDDDEPVIRLE